MGRLIDADRLSFVLNKNFGHTGGAAVFQQLIDIAPTEETKEDADRPPKGKWRLLNGKWTCSECGNKTDWPLKICDVCASEMEIKLEANNV